MYFLGAALLLAGAIWMTVNAARKDGAVAAILCFICGFYTIYYGIKNFAENKVPLILFLAGLALCVIFRPDMAAMSGAAAL
jgi:intracellular septation protein A